MTTATMPSTVGAPDAPLSRREMLRRIGGGFGTARPGRRCWPTTAPRPPRRPAARWRPKPPHFPREGEARHLPVHERRAVARRYVRPQAGAGEVRTARTRPPETTVDRARAQADDVAVQVPASTARAASRSASCSPRSAKCIDDICVIRSMHTDTPDHEPGLLLMNSRQHAADPAEHGLVADLRPGHREPEPARLRRAVPRQAGRRPAAVEQQLPARRLPGHAHQQHVDRPEDGHPHLEQPTCPADDAARSSSTCSKR